MKRFIFRKTTERDLNRVMPIYEGARRYMASTGNPGQWINGYPARENILRDIERGVSFVVENIGGEIEGVFSLIPGEDPTYSYIEGKWLSDMPYSTIHRIASAGKTSGMGRVIISWCKSHANDLRADTHEANRPMQKLLAETGFRHCGTIYLTDGRPRLAYQYQAEK